MLWCFHCINSRAKGLETPASNPIAINCGPLVVLARPCMGEWENGKWENGKNNQGAGRQVGK